MNKVIFKQEHCTIPIHRHHSPIQYMLGFLLGQHWVDVTRDGDLYNIRVDEDDRKSISGLNLFTARKVLYYLFKGFDNAG